MNPCASASAPFSDEPPRMVASLGMWVFLASEAMFFGPLILGYLNGLYKAELIHRRAPWKSRESVELATLQWVHWFNHIRLLEPIGYIAPAEAETNYWRQLASEAAEAVST